MHYPKWKTEDPGRFESYDLKHGKLLHMAFAAICCGTTVQARWNLETLDWPSATSDNASFLETVNQLRKHFNHLRSQPPKKQAPFPWLDL